MSVNGPVGWFPDPNGGNGLRYFDGRKWTKIAPPPALAPTAPPVSVMSTTLARFLPRSVLIGIIDAE